MRIENLLQTGVAKVRVCVARRTMRTLLCRRRPGAPPTAGAATPDAAAPPRPQNLDPLRQPTDRPTDRSTAPPNHPPTQDFIKQRPGAGGKKIAYLEG